MATSVSYRPQVRLTMPVVKQTEVNSCRENLREVKKAVKENQLTDISAMTQRMEIESKLNDAKVSPVKFVEEIRPQETELAKVAEPTTLTTPKTVTDVIAKFHKGNQPSKHEQSQVLMNQMNMFAASNMVLHGLV